MLGWGAADFFAKKTIDVIGDLKTLFWGQLVGSLALAVAWLAVGPSQVQASLTVPLVVFGVVSGWSYLVLYSGFERGQISVLSPIFASYAVVTALLSAVLFDEALGWTTVAALVVVSIGILLMSTDPREFTAALRGTNVRAGVPQVLLAMLVFSGWLVGWNDFLHDREWLGVTLAMRIIATIFLAGWAWKHRTALTVPDRSLWPFLVAIGLCDVGAYSAVSYGFGHSDLTSIVALLSGAFSLPTLVLARVFLRERLTLPQVFAACLILGGIAAVAAA
jgi:drug/metabolite transporter (DMT)-like permease